MYMYTGGCRFFTVLLKIFLGFFVMYMTYIVQYYITIIHSKWPPTSRPAYVTIYMYMYGRVHVQYIYPSQWKEHPYWNTVQWNLSNPDTTGPEESVLIKEVSLFQRFEMYTRTVLGEGRCVLFREVSLIQGVHFREVSLYMYMH